MKVSDLLEEIRTEVEDNIKSRWSDEKLLSFVKRAIRRINNIVVRNDLEFGKNEMIFYTQSGVSEYELPIDFMAAYALWNTDMKEKLTHRTSDQWESIYAASPVSNWNIRGDKLLIASVPVTSVNLKLIYWPTIDTASIKLTSYTPWDGRMDDAIVEYVSLRTKNTDEMTITVDAQITQEVENYIINTFKAIDPTVVDAQGWMGD